MNIPHTRVAIIGSGFSGIGVAIALKREGIGFTIFERRGEVGGTWWDNSYPGCKCDVPSHLYSFSFAPNPEWSHTYSKQPEIWAYLKGVAERFGILPHVRLNHDLLEARWDEAENRWHIQTSCGTWTADFLVSGAGALSEPSIPAITGMETFAGMQFHSATWNHIHDLSGERVAVIGTGALAIQFVPQIQPKVGRLYLFQRTPPWVMPHTDRPITARERALYRRFPFVQRLVRAWLYWQSEMVAIGFTKLPRLTAVLRKEGHKHLEEQVVDPKLRRQLTPHYDPGCKRLLMANDYFPSVAAPNVEIVTKGIQEVRAHSIVTADGRECEIDTIIFGTGFKVTDNPITQRVRGRGGMSLAQAWDESGARAYRGTTVPGFPNLFLMTGPNTGIGHTSLLVMIEAQIRYVVQCLRLMDRQKISTFEVPQQACEAYNEEIQRKMKRTVWSTGCASWYLDKLGRNPTIWPDFTWKYQWLMRRFDPKSYELVKQLERPSAQMAGGLEAPPAIVG